MMFRVNKKLRCKNTDTQSAGSLVQYLERIGGFTPKERPREDDVTYMTRTRPDTVQRGDLVGEPYTRNLPAWAEDAAHYFKVASEHETRGSGSYAIAFQISLPRELNNAQHWALAHDIVDTLMPDKPVLLVKHEPVKNGVAQPHLHILMGLRNQDGIERDQYQTFRRYNPHAPEHSGAQKDRFWNQWQSRSQTRYALSDLVNYHLARAGVEERVVPQSLRKRGIERDRLSWTNKAALSKATKAEELAQRQAIWEERCAHRQWGDVTQIPREEFVLLVRQWTRAYERGTALPRVSQEQWLEWAIRDRDETQVEVTRLEQQRDRAHAAVMIAEHRQRQPQRTRGMARHLARDNDMQQGLQGPDLERKRRRDREGYEYE